MKCLYCTKELENPKAKYCNDAHRMAFTRTNNPNKIAPEQPEQEVKTQPEQITRTTPMFIPNWKRNGFKSADDAMKYAIALTIKRVPSAVIQYKGKMISKDNIDVKALKDVQVLI